MNQLLFKKPTKDMKNSYMIQLDSLRAIAVFGVLIHHYLPQDFILNKLHCGSLGVILFFVLSGFLITSILLKNRDLIQQKQQSVWFFLRSFYIRRFLRLMPVYYLVILLTFIFTRNLDKYSLLWHLTYTSNFYFSFYDWDAVFSHFWSLAVEAQYYFIFPLIVLFCPRKYLVNIIIIIILIAPLFRFLLIEFNLGNGNREYIYDFCLF